MYDYKNGTNDYKYVGFRMSPSLYETITTIKTEREEMNHRKYKTATIIKMLIAKGITAYQKTAPKTPKNSGKTENMADIDILDILNDIK